MTMRTPTGVQALPRSGRRTWNRDRDREPLSTPRAGSRCVCVGLPARRVPIAISRPYTARPSQIRTDQKMVLESTKYCD
eukprot:410391-Prymnesium_polylepis.2